MPTARMISVIFATSLLLSAGCGGCSEDAAGTGGSNASDVATAEDARHSDADGSAADDASTGTDATDTTSARDADDAPSDADATDVDVTDGSGSDASASCGLYQSLCDGDCIATSMDPDNCGDCGTVCASNQVCSGGRCVDQTECMAGLTACERQCVDTDSNSDHCGGCNLACSSGQGCVRGQCEPLVQLGQAPAKCVDGGPVIDLGDVAGEERSCSGRLAELTFRWGICSCEDVILNDELHVDAYDSSVGPYTPGGEGGGVGANGSVNLNNEVDVTGSLWVAGSAGVTSNNQTEVGQRLLADGPIDFNSPTTVGSDAYVGGAMTIGQTLSITDTLYVPPGAPVDPNVSYGSLQRRAIDVAPPCSECAPEARIPVATIVDAHRTNNDNALIGLDPTEFDRPAVNQARRLDLPCGHYYLSAIDLNSETTIVAHGNTALYIGGDIRAGHELAITLAPNAQLDLFVAGNVNASNRLTLGSPNYPALMRVYIGGSQGLQVNNPTRAGAFIYAVPGGVQNNNQTEIFGGVYAQNYQTNNNTLVHFDRRVTTVGNDCPDSPPEPTPGGDAGLDAGPDAGSTDAGDGGGSSVCTTEGDSCADDSECCSPLLCTDGQCQLLACQPLNASCSDNSECCSGTCGFGICVGG